MGKYTASFRWNKLLKIAKLQIFNSVPITTKVTDLFLKINLQPNTWHLIFRFMRNPVSQMCLADENVHEYAACIAVFMGACKIYIFK